MLPPLLVPTPQGLYPTHHPVASEKVLTHPPNHPPLGMEFLQDLEHSFPLRLDMTVLCNLCARCCGPTHVCFLVGGLVSGSSQGSGVVDTVGLPMGLPSPSAP